MTETKKVGGKGIDVRPTETGDVQSCRIRVVIVFSIFLFLIGWEFELILFIHPLMEMGHRIQCLSGNRVDKRKCLVSSL